MCGVLLLMHEWHVSFPGRPMILWQRFIVLLAVVVLPAITPNDVSAQVSREAELKGKMVAIVSGKFVKWPKEKTPTQTNPLTIGIIGNDPFVDDNGVNHLEKKLARTGTIVMRFANADAYMDCHVLVVSKSANFEEALAKTRGNSVLMISESPGLAKKGAAINLVFDMRTNKIRLEINPTTAKAENLEINQGLLRSPAVDIVK